MKHFLKKNLLLTCLLLVSFGMASILISEVSTFFGVSEVLAQGGEGAGGDPPTDTGSDPPTDTGSDPRTGSSGGCGGGSALCNPLTVDSITGLLQAIVNIITIIAVPIIVFFIILAGFKYVTAGGKSDQIKESTQALTYALIGAVLIIGANAIVEIVANLVNSFTT